MAYPRRNPRCVCGTGGRWFEPTQLYQPSLRCLPRESELSPSTAATLVQWALGPLVLANPDSFAHILPNFGLGDR
jgi:hypothetical protein